MISIKRRWVQVPIWVAWFQQDDTRHLSPLWSKTDLHRFYSSPKAHTSVKEVRVSSLSRELLPYPLGISFTPTPLGTSFLEISSLLSAASTSQRFKDKTKSSNKQNSYSYLWLSWSHYIISLLPVIVPRSCALCGGFLIISAHAEVFFSCLMGCLGI